MASEGGSSMRGTLGHCPHLMLLWLGGSSFRPSRVKRPAKVHSFERARATASTLLWVHPWRTWDIRIRGLVCARSLHPRDHSRCHVIDRAHETYLASGNHPVED